MKLFYFFCGGCKLGADRADAEKILNLCMHYGFVYKNLKTGENYISLECSMYTADLLRQACFERGIIIHLIQKYGVPDIMLRYRKRIGVIAGLILAMATILWSEKYVWDIRVTGCEYVEENTVISELCDQNFGLGTYIPDTDIDVIENRVLINSPDIAWISINIKGSVAYIEIREKTTEPDEKNKNPANLIASWDGQIESIEAAQGNIVVKVGQHVRKGDLLVSGIYDSNAWGYRYTRASGEVFARTVHEIHIEIPLYYEEKCYKDVEYAETTLFFFSKEIKLYRNTGFLVGTYDTICKVEDVCLFDGTKLPFSLMTKIYRWYSYETMKRDENEVMELAYDELNLRLTGFTSQGATLLRKNITWSLTDEMYILDCTVSMIENLAQISEFEVVE